jgi:hypothetical protein
MGTPAALLNGSCSISLQARLIVLEIILPRVWELWGGGKPLSRFHAALIRSGIQAS